MFLTCLSLGTGDRFACSNVHVSYESSIFGNTFSMAFLVFHGFVTPIKGCRVTDFYLTSWF